MAKRFERSIIKSTYISLYTDTKYHTPYEYIKEKPIYKQNSFSTLLQPKPTPKPKRPKPSNRVF